MTSLYQALFSTEFISFASLCFILSEINKITIIKFYPFIEIKCLTPLNNGCFEEMAKKCQYATEILAQNNLSIVLKIGHEIFSITRWTEYKDHGNSWVIKNVHQEVKIKFLLTPLFFGILRNAYVIVTKNCFQHEYKSKQSIQIKSSTWLGQKRVKILSYAWKINNQGIDETGKEKLLKANHKTLPANNPLLSKLKIMS